jgi:hypothetical protein
MGTCPVVARFFLAKDFEHVLGLVGSLFSMCGIPSYSSLYNCICGLDYAIDLHDMIDNLDRYVLYSKFKLKKERDITPN